MKKNKLSMTFKNAIDYLKSINYVGDGYLDSETLKKKD